jgi:hypothetical protein
MTVQSLRSTQSPDGRWMEILSSLSDDRITLSSITDHAVEPLVNEYPYTDQHRLTGTIDYEEEYDNDREPLVTRSVQGTFEFRTGSQMFILKMDTDIPTPETIIKDLNAALSQQVRIYRNLFVTPEYLWDFFEQADEILDITVLVDGEEQPYDEVEDTAVGEVVGEYPVESARVVYRYNGDAVHVKYANGSLSIRNASDEANEYVIQLFEQYVLSP